MTGRYIISLVFLIGFMVGIVSTTAEIAGASESPAGKPTHCRLDVVVDPATKKISGTMDIQADKGRELTIYRNGTRLKEFHSPGLKRDIGKDKGEDPFVVRYDGPIQLKYEITIESSEDNILNNQEIVLDEEYDVFRRLSIKEMPPTVERLITDEKSIIVTPASASGLYTELIVAFGENGSVLQFMKNRPDATRKYGRRKGETIFLQKAPNQEPKARKSLDKKKTPQQKVRRGDRTTMSKGKDMQPGFRRQCLQRTSQRLKENDLASASLLIVGLENPLLKRLQIETPPLDTGFRIIVRENPFNPRKVIAIAAGISHEEVVAAQSQVADYRKYSVLSFDKGKLVNKSLEKSDNGIRRSVANFDSAGREDSAKILSNSASCLSGSMNEKWRHTPCFLPDT